MSIGSRIKDARKAKGLTQNELAELLGISNGAVANYESEVSTPRLEILIKAIDVLGVDANYLYQDDLPQLKHSAPFAPLNGSKEERKKQMVSQLETLLTIGGYILPGGDLTDTQLRGMLAIVDMLDALFPFPQEDQ